MSEQRTSDPVSLPKWPPAMQPSGGISLSRFNELAAEAALTRLRVAVDALKKIQKTARSIHFVESNAQMIARETLAAIGPLPGDQS